MPHMTAPPGCDDLSPDAPGPGAIGEARNGPGGEAGVFRRGGPAWPPPAGGNFPPRRKPPPQGGHTGPPLHPSRQRPFRARPQGGICSTWGVNPRTGPAQHLPEPRRADTWAELPAGKDLPALRGLGFWRPSHLGFTTQAEKITWALIGVFSIHKDGARFPLILILIMLLWLQDLSIGGTMQGKAIQLLLLAAVSVVVLWPAATSWALT